MIYCWTGKNGTGKTFEMVRQAHKLWLNGTDIYSNTVLYFDSDKLEFPAYDSLNCPNKFTRLERFAQFIHSKLFHIWKDKMGKTNALYKRGAIHYFENIQEILHIRNALIVFDEAQVLFNARLWQSLPDEFQYKLQQHRKHNLDLFCTTPNMGSIDIVYRRLVHEWYNCVLLWKFRLFQISRIDEKEVSQLYNNVDDLKVETLGSKYLLIHKWSRVLYDTMYDIGFRRFKIIWRIYYKWEKGMMMKKQQYLIVPKKYTLETALKVISSSKSLYRSSK